MAFLVSINCKLYVGAFDFSGKINQLKLDHAPEMKDSRVFGDVGKPTTKGLEGVSLDYTGFNDFADNNVDETAFGNVAVANRVITACPIAGAAGEIAYFFKSIQPQYSQGHTFGELVSFAVTAKEANSVLVRGTVAKNGTVSSSASGTAYNLGAVSATQKVYAALHVLSASAGDTLDVIVESDALEAFATPATKITFTQAAAATSEMLSANGQIDDIWWRVSWTVGGVDPSFVFVVTIGIK